jgi:hypothetical protein
MISSTSPRLILKKLDSNNLTIETNLDHLTVESNLDKVTSSPVNLFHGEEYNGFSHLFELAIKGDIVQFFEEIKRLPHLLIRNANGETLLHSSIFGFLKHQNEAVLFELCHGLLCLEPKLLFEVVESPGLSFHGLNPWNYFLHFCAGKKVGDSFINLLFHGPLLSLVKNNACEQDIGALLARYPDLKKYPDLRGDYFSG